VGYSDEDVMKIAGRNHLRAMRRMEKVAAELQRTETPLVTEPPREGMDVKESPYRWVIVALGGLMGLRRDRRDVFTGVFLAPDVHGDGWSRAGISFAMTINFLVMAFGSFAGARPAIGGERASSRCVARLLLGFALVFASHATTLWAFSSPLAC
jgi:hypothetical protein